MKRFLNHVPVQLLLILLLTACQQSNPPGLSPEATPQRTASAAPSLTPSHRRQPHADGNQAVVPVFADGDGGGRTDLCLSDQHRQ